MASVLSAAVAHDGDGKRACVHGALHTAPLTASCGCAAAVADVDGSDLENESNTTA